MKFKVIAPDKSEQEFDDRDTALKAAKQLSAATNKVIEIKYWTGSEWDTYGIAYPNGMVQEGTGGFGFFKKLPVGRKR